MALIFDSSTCAICGRIVRGTDYTATSGVVFEPGDRLYEYCDAPLHVACVDGWKYRERFSRGHYASRLATHQYCSGVLIEMSHWFLGVGPATREKQPYYFRIAARDWPQTIHTHYAGYQTTIWSSETGLTGNVVPPIEDIFSFLRVHVPDMDSIADLRLRRLDGDTGHYSRLGIPWERA